MKKSWILCLTLFLLKSEGFWAKQSMDFHSKYSTTARIDDGTIGNVCGEDEVSIESSHYSIYYGETLNVVLNTGGKQVNASWKITGSGGSIFKEGTGTDTGNITYIRSGNFRVVFNVTEEGHNHVLEAQVSVAAYKINYDVANIRFSKSLKTNHQTEGTKMIVPVTVSTEDGKEVVLPFKEIKSMGASEITGVLSGTQILKKGVQILEFDLSGTLNPGKIQFRFTDCTAPDSFFTYKID